MPNLGGAIGRCYGKIVSSRNSSEQNGEFENCFAESIKIVRDALSELSDEGYKVTCVKRGQDKLEWFDFALLHGYVILKLQRSRYTLPLEFKDVQVGDMVKMSSEIEEVLQANHAAGILNEYDDIRRDLVDAEMRVTSKDATDQTIECEVLGHTSMWFAASGLTCAESKYARLDWSQDGLHVQVEGQEAECRRYVNQLAPACGAQAAAAGAGVAGTALQVPTAAVLPQQLAAAKPFFPMGAKVAAKPASEAVAGTGISTAVQAVTPVFPMMSLAGVVAPTSATVLENMMMPGLAIQGGVSSGVVLGAASIAAVVPVAALGLLTAACQVSALSERFVPVSDPDRGLQHLCAVLRQLIEKRQLYSAAHWNCNHFADLVLQELVDPSLFTSGD